jgi:DNA-binding MarR family transcriptional regulator
MPALSQDIADLDAAMRSLVKTMKRPQTWTVLTDRANLTIDRPSATILRILLSQPGNCRLHDLATRIGVEAPSVTRTAQQLEQTGLAYRERDEKDGRAFTLQITEKGRIVARKLETAQRQILESALQNWPDADRQQFTNLFQRFSHDLSQQYTATPNK